MHLRGDLKGRGFRPRRTSPLFLSFRGASAPRNPLLPSEDYPLECIPWGYTSQPPNLPEQNSRPTIFAEQVSTSRVSRRKKE